MGDNRASHLEQRLREVLGAEDSSWVLGVHANFFEGLLACHAAQLVMPARVWEAIGGAAHVNVAVRLDTRSHASNGRVKRIANGASRTQSHTHAHGRDAVPRQLDILSMGLQTSIPSRESLCCQAHMRLTAWHRSGCLP